MSAPWEPMVPVVHLNGSDGQRLAEALNDAASAVFKAQDALVAAGPNARDYYPRGPEAFEQARVVYDGWQRRLQEVRAELEQVLTATIAANAERAWRR